MNIIIINIIIRHWRLAEALQHGIYVYIQVGLHAFQANSTHCLWAHTFSHSVYANHWAWTQARRPLRAAEGDLTN